MKRLFFLPLLLLFAVSLSAQSTGRQLFVDDALIETSDMTRVCHAPVYCRANPVLRADRPWELGYRGDPYAAPFSGGVWFDERDDKFKMWYSAGGGKTYGLVTCYAESTDGVKWEKPLLNVVPGTNIVDNSEHDCVSVLLDKHETDPAKRYKMFATVFNSPSSVSIHLKYSADGIHWGPNVATSGEVYDRTGVYWDPFRGEYVLSLKTINGIYRRARNYLANADPELAVSLAHRTFDTESDKYIRYWFNADDQDPRNPMFPELRPQIYNHEAIAYESLLLGYFTIWQGPENDECDRLQIQKRNEVLVGWSRDGFNWDRSNRQPFHPVAADNEAWNAGNVQSVCGSPVIVGDSLYFYMSGRYNNPSWDSNFATGLATMRRDGFVSMDARGGAMHTLTTVPIECSARFLFVNVDATEGALLVEMLDSLGTPVKGYGVHDCRSMKGIDSTCRMVEWRHGIDMESLVGKSVKLKFHLRDGALYAFWFSDDRAGYSGGYTAGGGRGLSGTGRDIESK